MHEMKGMRVPGMCPSPGPISFIFMQLSGKFGQVMGLGFDALQDPPLILIYLYINIAYRCLRYVRVSRERDDKEVGEEVHENDEDVSHRTTGQTMQVRNSNLCA